MRENEAARDQIASVRESEAAGSRIMSLEERQDKKLQCANLWYTVCRNSDLSGGDGLCGRVWMIRNVVFDVGYVLLDYTWKKDFLRFGYDEEGVRRLAGHLFGGTVQGNSKSVWQLYDNGQISDEELRSECLSRCPEDKEALEWFFEDPAVWCRVRNDLADMILPVKEKGYGIYLLSNYPDTLWQIQVASKPFYSLIDGRVVSYMEHFGKPDPRFYRILLDRYQLEGSECLFLDDRKENTEAAGRLGFSVITLDSGEARERAVQKLCGLPNINGIKEGSAQAGTLK